VDAGQYALGVFFDIRGAFDNTPIVSVLKALSERKIIFAVQQWISTLLQQRKVCVCEYRRFAVIRYYHFFPSAAYHKAEVFGC